LRCHSDFYCYTTTLSLCNVLIKITSSQLSKYLIEDHLWLSFLLLNIYLHRGIEFRHHRETILKSCSLTTSFVTHIIESSEEGFKQIRSNSKSSEINPLKFN